MKIENSKLMMKISYVNIEINRKIPDILTDKYFHLLSSLFQPCPTRTIHRNCFNFSLDCALKNHEMKLSNLFSCSMEEGISCNGCLSEVTQKGGKEHRTQLCETPTKACVSSLD